MCVYVSKSIVNAPGGPKEVFNNWIKKVKDIIKATYRIDFRYTLIGSGSRNMVICCCNNPNYFDLDYQITLTSWPEKMKPKIIKDIFRNVFNGNKPKGFKDLKDRSQSLRTKNLSLGYGFDIIITRFDEDNNFYLLYNKKDSNDANNEDYSWLPRKDMAKYRERIKQISGPVMWNKLRDIYLNKRHDHKDDNSIDKKKSYQLFNESVVETLTIFKKNI